MDDADHKQQTKLTYSIAEAKQATGLSRSTIYNLLQQGRLVSIKVGRRRLITALSLSSLLVPQ